MNDWYFVFLSLKSETNTYILFVNSIFRIFIDLFLNWFNGSFKRPNILFSFIYLKNAFHNEFTFHLLLAFNVTRIYVLNLR